MMVVLNSRMIYATGISNDAITVSTELSAVSFGRSAYSTSKLGVLVTHEQRSDPFEHPLEDFKAVSGHYIQTF